MYGFEKQLSHLANKDQLHRWIDANVNEGTKLILIFERDERIEVDACPVHPGPAHAHTQGGVGMLGKLSQAEAFLLVHTAVELFKPKIRITTE
jgi:hypothetical protein